MEPMQIRFPGGKQVTADYDGFTINTDQPVAEGGQGSAPQPYDLFLASIGTCAGIYVLSFCSERGIDPKGLTLTVVPRVNEKTHLFEKINLHIGLPPHFPIKYTNALIRVANLCTVKRSLSSPPEFETTAGPAGVQ